VFTARYELGLEIGFVLKGLNMLPTNIHLPHGLMSGAIPLLPICICGYLNGIVTVCPYTAVVHPWDAAINVSHYSHLLQEAPLCV
jgi:hypothetical protein